MRTATWIGLLGAVALTHCASQEAPGEGPDPHAAAAAAEAVCKLLQGARQECEATASKVTWGDRTLTLKANLIRAEEKFGQFSFEAEVTLTEGDTKYVSPAVGFGAARTESFQKGFHEWAVVSGVAIVDALLDDPARPALLALIKTPTMPEGSENAGSFGVLRGFSVIRGDKPPEDGISHPGLVGALSPFAAGLEARTPHVLSLHRISGIDGIELKCWADGARSEALCKATEGYEWPVGMNWEIKQTYVLSPGS